MWPLVTYSNYFEIVSTVTFLRSRIELILDIFLFKTVTLYHIFIHDYTGYNISSTWFLDIVISTCFYLLCQYHKHFYRDGGWPQSGGLILHKLKWPNGISWCYFWLHITHKTAKSMANLTSQSSGGL